MTNDKLIELWDSEIEFLKNLFGENKILVEIGCFKGKTTLALAESNVVIAIDQFEENYDPQDLASSEVKEAEKIFRKQIKGKNIIWYKQKSEEVLKNWRLAVDGVFVDGCHQEEAVRKDAQWIRFLKEGGIIAFHDYGQWIGVTKAVDELVRPYLKIIGFTKRIIAFQK